MEYNGTGTAFLTAAIMNFTKQQPNMNKYALCLLGLKLAYNVR